MASTGTSGFNRSWEDTPPVSPPIRHINEEIIMHMPWLDNVSKPIHNLIEKLYGQPGQTSYKIKDFLNGVWLGTVLHPVLILLPIGSWTSSLVLDIASLGDESEGVARSADLLLWLGNATSLAAAVTGLTNWVDIYGMEERKGILHGMLNIGAATLNIASGILRLTGQRRAGIALASTSFAILMYTAHLGGELSYANAIGVNHVAGEFGSNDFVPVMNEADLVPGKLKRVDVAGIPAVLVKEGNAIYAIAATCSHLGGPLDEGNVENGVIYCPWHRSGFRLCDGSVANSPAVYAQPTFAVRTRNGKIELRRLEHA